MADDAKASTKADDQADATRWDLTPLYSSLTGEDFRQGYATLEKNTASLEKFFDQHHVRRLAQAPHADETLAALAAECLRLVNDLLMLADRLEGFVSAIVATDSYNDAAQRELSKLERLETRRRQLGVRLNGWIGSMGEQLPRLIAMRPELKAHTFFLTDTARQSRWLMREDLEALAAELTLDAGGAFGKLQGNVTSQLKVDFERDGRIERLPITVVRNLSFDPDPEVRRRAYEAEIGGWESIKTTVAACLNGVKGT
ncbi:MAG TPA: hypothetical protein VG433_02340, partial [Pirellulales bacterium]|nr:hypothetical protein [Pirellulales bacterium]